MKKAIKIISVALCVASCCACLAMKLPIFASAITDTGFKHLMKDLQVAASIINTIVPAFKNNPVILKDSDNVFIPPLRTEGQKQVAMDFHAVTKCGEHIVIEMQAVRHIMFDERALFYACATYSGQLADKDFISKEWYTKLKKVYAIQFVNYDTELASGINSQDNKISDTLIGRKANNPMLKNQYIKHFALTDKQSGQIISDLQMIQIELLRADRIMNLSPNYNNKTELEWWLSLLRNSSLYSDAVCCCHELIQKGFNSLRLDGWQQEDKTEYIKEVTDINLYAAAVNDKVQYEIQQVRDELQPQIDKQAAKILSTQIRQNYRKFKDVFSKDNNGIIYFNPHSGNLGSLLPRWIALSC